MPEYLAWFLAAAVAVSWIAFMIFVVYWGWDRYQDARAERTFPVVDR